MAMAFESPGHLERRIAANMAADVSSDSSLGISRKGRSIASLSMSTTFEDENQSYMADYVRTNMQTPNVRVQEQIRKSRTPRSTRKLAEIINSSSTSSSTSKSDVKSSTLKVIQRTPARSEVSFTTESSTNDLLVSNQAALRPNSSFPGIGAAQTSLSANLRVDGKKLHMYLNKVNEGLQQENVQLTEERDSIKLEFERALLDNERLRKQIDLRNSTPSTTPMGSPNVGRNSEEMDELQREVDLLKREVAQQESIIDRLSNDRSEKSADQMSLVEREHLRERICELESDLQQERDARQDDEDHYSIEMKAAVDESKRLKKQLEDERSTAQTKMDRIRTELERVKKDESGPDNEVADLREDLRMAEARLDEYSEKIRELESEIEELQESRNDMEAELEEYDRLREEYDLLVKDFNDREAESETKQEELNAANDKISDLEIIVSEKENDRLTLELKLSQAKESGELQQLKEKIVLLETTLAMTREAAAATKGSPSFSKFGKGGVSEGDITPLHPNVAALRKPVDTPKSPPVLAELSNASWMQSEATLGENDLKREISVLRHEHEAARNAVDEMLGNLQDANVFKDLVKANEKVKALEDQLLQMQKSEERVMRRLEKLRCKSCKAHVSLPADLDKSQNMSMNSSVGETSSLGRSVRLTYQQNEQVVEKVNQELKVLKERWALDINRIDEKSKALDAEKKELLKEKEQWNKNRQETKERVMKMHANTLHDLGRARRMIGAFGADLQQESARFKALKLNRSEMDQESSDVERELERTRVQIESINTELKNKFAVFERLNEELRETSIVDDSLAMHVHSLQVKVDGFAQVVERLRSERTSILQERQELYNRRQQNQQKQLSTHEELRTTQEALLAHQRQIDEQVETIERLHSELRKQNGSSEKVQNERDQVYEQRREILDDVAGLETMLKKVCEQSRQFGIELEDLRGRRNQTAKQSTQAIDRQVHEELEATRNRYEKRLTRLSEEYGTLQHAATSRHQSECRGLLLQIRYEKAKFMRESDLRADLIHQKKYLLGLVGGLELSEEATVRFLADLEKSRGEIQSRLKKQENRSTNNQQSEALKKFKSVTFAILAICRAKKMAENWQISLQIKSSLRQAHSMAKKARLSAESEMPASANVKTVKG
ncbi:uncharacterized protein FA14DRAFT_83818 [Meira miltonrushii]|uniref:Pericentrin/AKAP-450 centrosomal targeting domain-containing protein n=1 Tax=Meira miltonrushii TaxID=1280837 RepID=A0A316V725_9BASI|nr:uncharacterized protein FA14DRAFT_83818 [Meira miltonrushii]PWN32013.1 hypothetical protein FA14DRAFT_83818 [Meira miltonrushii]